VTAVIAAIALPLVGLVGCSADDLRITPRAEAAPPTVLDAEDASAASIAASEQLFESSGLVFVATAGYEAQLADDAVAAGAPLLVDGAGLPAELERLGVRVVVHASDDSPEGAGEFEQVSINGDADPATTDLPDVERGEPSVSAVLFTDEDAPAAAVAPKASVEAVGGSVEGLPAGDPRTSSETVAIARDHADATVLAIGAEFGETETFAARFATAATATEVPGGGMLPLDDRILVADYGHPGDGALGVLGEHDLDWAVRDVKERAAEYQALTDTQVVPTFEIIATVASASAGDDGDYSSESDVESLRPWIDRAAEEGIYVVLDLQPGHTSFLDQAKLYEELLREPNVGLALDPEWRLAPGEQHMVQIGSVSADEVNATLDWLADLTAEHQLPQKAVVLHQFRGDMLEDRDEIDTSHDELRLVVHVDGHGTPPLKFETWNALVADLPDGILLGWKNFIDEDTPTFTPAETLAVEPQPSLVTYQ
jgi:hypothetical protein